MADEGENTPLIEELRKIDTTVIDQLTALHRDRAVLEERLERLEAERSAISQVVYDRIRGDYQSRKTALSEEATPLAEQASRQYGELAALFDQAQAASRTAELDKEELDVRHGLGEFEDDEFAERRAEIDRLLGQKQQDLARIAEVKEKFAAALEAEEPQRTAPPEVLAQAPPAIEEPTLLDEEPTSISQSLASEPRQTPVREDAPPAFEEAGTQLLSALPAAEEEPASGAGETSATGVDKTVLLPIARLVPFDAGPEAEEIVLEPFTALGRTDENQVRIDDPAVSRHHAQIVLEERGFVLRDLESQNGTYLNEEAVEERLLEEGDLLQIGSARFVFHCQP